MNLLINISVIVLLFVAAFIGLFSLLTMINVLVDIQNFDELERKVVSKLLLLVFVS